MLLLTDFSMSLLHAVADVLVDLFDDCFSVNSQFIKLEHGMSYMIVQS